MRLTVVRHGLDDQGYRGGWSQLGLSEEGKSQVRSIRSYIKKHPLEYRYNTIISSDLPRAKETADILNENTIYPVELNASWREMNNGLLAGLKNEIANERFPGLYSSTLGMDDHYPEGESPREFYDRIRKSWVELISRMVKEQGDILLVTHGGVINILYHLIEEQEWHMKSKIQTISHASIHQFDIKEDFTHIHMRNFTDHL